MDIVQQIKNFVEDELFKTMYKKGDVDIKVSTAFLELNHSYRKGEERWYETMIFPEIEWLECGYQNRYETKEEAIKDHHRILDLLKTKKYRLDSTDKNHVELVMNESEDIEDRYSPIYSFFKALR